MFVFPFHTDTITGLFLCCSVEFCLLCSFPMSVALAGVLFGPIDGAFGSILVPIGLVYVAQDVYPGVVLLSYCDFIHCSTSGDIIVTLQRRFLLNVASFAII